MRSYYFDRVEEHCESHQDEGVELMVCKTQVALGTMVHVFNPSSQDTERCVSESKGQPGLHRRPSLINNNKTQAGSFVGFGFCLAFQISTEDILKQYFLTGVMFCYWRASVRLTLFSDGQRMEFQTSQPVTGLGGLSFGTGFCLFQLVGKESHWKL